MMNEFDWIEVLANLRSGAIGLTEYTAAVKAGDLADRSAFRDDMEFQGAYPGHPQGLVNRSRRIAAADSIRNELLKKSSGGG